MILYTKRLIYKFLIIINIGIKKKFKLIFLFRFIKMFTENLMAVLSGTKPIFPIPRVPSGFYFMVEKLLSFVITKTNAPK